ncbi:MAG: AAA family ATPase [Lachnospiraceae bacterium]
MYQQQIQQALTEIQKNVIGKEKVVEKMLCAILAGGHVLMEDIPGVGKTTLALSLAQVLSLDSKRMQFTPDVLPSDIIGFNMYDKAKEAFVYKKGTIMTNLFLADEINRTSSRTQSALLEVMEENTVTVDGITREVPVPFFVIATQNPIGSAGTQMLPDSQLDRFMIQLSMGYPTLENEIDIMRMRKESRQIQNLEPVLTKKDILQIQNEIEQVYVHDLVYEYAANLSAATRTHEWTELGMSPRGSVALIRMAAAWAYIHGSDFVKPTDCQNVFFDVAQHRIILNAKARIAHHTKKEVLDDILRTVQMPKAGTK